MKNVKLAGVVILYNPPKESFQNILDYIAEVDKLYLIDNSEKKNIINIQNDKIIYIHNPKNFGIAKSLNIAANRALEEGYKYLLTLDQDSKMTSDILKKMKEFILTTDLKNIGLISPYHDILTLEEKPKEEIEYKMEVMTSGNIIYLDAYQQIGGFKEELFIDGVDIEYGLNLNKNGFKVIRLNYLIMPHKLGNTRLYTIFNKKIIASNHNALRRYYMTRNTLYINEWYKDLYPDYCKMLINSQKGQIKRVLFIEKNKMNKMKMIIKGYRDYKKGIKGEINL